jgi:hypothetical protein
MRVTPGSALGVFAQVLDADIVPADPGAASVHDHELAVVAEVDLEAVAPALGGIECREFYARGSQVPDTDRCARSPRSLSRRRAHTRAAGAGFFRQDGAEPPAQGVVAQNIELKQDVVLGLRRPASMLSKVA